MNAAEIVEIVEEDEEEKFSEEWCFICKDGGDVMLCDYKDCPKVYHEKCLEKDILEDEEYICEWHKCYICSKEPKLYCYCCPHAVCDRCTTHAEFIRLKDDKGLCNQCQEYVFALEEIQEYDAAEGKIDLKDPNTFEGLFLGYWEIIKKDEEITFDDVCASKSRKRGVKSKFKDDSKYSLDDDVKPRKRSFKSRYKEYDPKFSLSDHAVEEDAEDCYNTVSKKAKGMEFIGWGSKPLIEFLKSVGEETKEAMPPQTVESVIRKYIRQKNLLDPEKKKKTVCCDEKLYSIFRKKSVLHRKILKLLDSHFKENVEQEEFLMRLGRGFGEETEKKVLTPCKKQKTEERSDVKPTPEKEKKPEMRATGFAVISADNLKRVYLRKGLILELLKKQKESFANKVLGSFVKVKNDPRDPIAYQILQVTGIRCGDEQSESMLLYTATREVRISKLEDSDIGKEEVDDLKEKVSNGLLRQPTVVEMEEKAKALHEDITKHWIARQLTVLQKRINFANEKGWKQELEEYLEERELLQKSSEQERLLRETPSIIEELVEIKPDRATSSDSSRQGNISGLTQEPAPVIFEELVEIKPDRATSSDSSRQGSIGGLTQEPAPVIFEELVEIKPDRATSCDSSRQGNVSGLSQEQPPVINID